MGPACENKETLRQLMVAGVNFFRLNFAHGSHDWLIDNISWHARLPNRSFHVEARLAQKNLTLRTINGLQKLFELRKQERGVWSICSVTQESAWAANPQR